MVKRANRSYTTEFKNEAVALVTEQGYSVPKAAASLGCCAVNVRYRVRLSDNKFSHQLYISILKVRIEHAFIKVKLQKGRLYENCKFNNISPV
jgi:hypothetical protein